MPLDPRVVDRLDTLLASDDLDRERRYPGATGTRQPVHTNLFTTCGRSGLQP